MEANVRTTSCNLGGNRNRVRLLARNAADCPSGRAGRARNHRVRYEDGIKIPSRWMPIPPPQQNCHDTQPSSPRVRAVLEMPPADCGVGKWFGGVVSCIVDGNTLIIKVVLRFGNLRTVQLLPPL